MMRSNKEKEFAGRSSFTGRERRNKQAGSTTEEPACLSPGKARSVPLRVIFNSFKGNIADIVFDFTGVFGSSFFIYA